MSRTILIGTLLLAALPLAAQDQTVRGTITYIAGDVVYTSLGRDAGLRDSSLIFVGVQPESLAQLKVFAVSSKSSACRILAKRRSLSVGDGVWTAREGRGAPGANASGVTMRDSAHAPGDGRGLPPAPGSLREEAQTSALSLRGRIGLQYFTSRTSDAAQTMTQPGVVVNLAGRFKDSPISFDLYGTLRSMTYGTSNPLSSRMTNRTRIYKLALNYSDSLNRISLGRVMPQVAASAGYIDGLLVTRKLGAFTVGSAIGFEPVYSQRTFSSDMKKFFVFGRYEEDGALRYSVGTSYARTYSRSILDREVVSWTLDAAPAPEIFILAQSDIDLRSKSGNELVLRPKLTSMFATVNYRLSAAVSLGAGLSAWRPLYSFAAVSMLPDSLFDQTLESTPQLNVNIWLPSGITFFESYSPRFSEEPFGRQYLNYSSLAFADIFRTGITVRGTMNMSVSGLSTTEGVGGSVQRTLLETLECTLRYQHFDYEMDQLGEISTTHSLALDLMAPLSKNLAGWGSVEKLWGVTSGGLSVFLELSWRF